MEIIRKDINGNIINKSNKDKYHINIIENVTIIDVESYKQYNILDETTDEEDENKDEALINNYKPKKEENISNDDPLGVSRGIKCIII